MADINKKDAATAEKSKVKAEKKAKKANSAGFFRSVIAERKKITWYGGKQSVQSTLAVLVTMIVIAAIIGGVDWLLGQGIDLVSRIPELF
ncbi:MAG: preprotein translocase subunit SecE [Clostridia bacterium]|jgi:preprotein translocase SecE subunit|nr:preprotein translocase subunit SecE [Clostridia bacterium]